MKTPKTTYTLIMLNQQGASEQTGPHASRTAVRRQIRTWDAKHLTARVWDSEGTQLYDGPALGFGARPPRDAAAEYRAAARYIRTLTTADAKILAASPAPVYREHVAPIVAQMAARHAHSEFNAAKDAQDVDAVMYYTSARAIQNHLRRSSDGSYAASQTAAVPAAD